MRAHRQKTLDWQARAAFPADMFIAGVAIEKYINEALGSRFEQAKIKLLVTDAFRRFEIKGTLPALMGAALNIVDNAIYWIGTSPSDGAEVKPLHLRRRRSIKRALQKRQTKTQLRIACGCNP